MRCSACILLLLLTAPALVGAAGDAARGRYVYQAAGACGCHTKAAGGGEPLAGGRALKTPFGTFYSTNITSDPETGIGRWSEDEFVRAMTQGVAPDGRQLFPVFPYTSFAGMTREDLLDLKAYLFAQPAVKRRNRPHDAWPPFGWRWPLPIWKKLNLPLPPPPLDAQRLADPRLRRGSYLVNAVGHCPECHTPRNLLGGLRSGWHLAGSQDGPEGELALNLTPDRKTGIGTWSTQDITWLLQTGFKPDGDDVQGLMAESIKNGYSHLTEADAVAIAAYLQAIPPVEHALLRKKK